MGWLARLLGATPAEQLNGISLDTTLPYWELEGKTTFPDLLRSLNSGLLPPNAILYFEGGSPIDKRLVDFFEKRSIQPQVHVAVGTIWPKPHWYHVPAKSDNLLDLAVIAEDCAEPELAIHFHAYAGDTVLLQWHDAFDIPMLLSGKLPESSVKAFAQSLAMTCTKGECSGERADAPEA